jgi:hypothetical protein
VAASGHYRSGTAGIDESKGDRWNPMEPTIEQLKALYRLIRQAVMLSSYISFVELSEDRSLYVYLGRYDSPLDSSILCITPNGEVSNDE